MFDGEETGHLAVPQTPSFINRYTLIDLMIFALFCKARAMEVADDSTTSASTHSARSLSSFDDIPDEIIRRCIRQAVAEDPRYASRPLFLYFPGPLATLRHCLSSSRSFRRDTLPLMIRLAWDGELNVGRRLLHSSQLFLQAPSSIHLGGNMIKCCVIRQSNPFFFLPSFELYEVDALSLSFVSDLIHSRPPLLKANECSDGSYEIIARGAGTPCARIVTHPNQLSFTLKMIDQTSSKKPQASKSLRSSSELEAVYQTFVNGKVVPRMITVKLMNRVSSPSFCEPLMAAHNSEVASHDDAMDRDLIQQCQEPGEWSTFINRAPYRSPTLHCWCLDFGGRVQLASVKNCQLHLNEDDPINRFQFGKVRQEGLTTTYTLDFDPRCMSALQAFAIALTTFKRKAFKGA
jgi:hypothetical protein